MEYSRSSIFKSIKIPLTIAFVAAFLAGCSDGDQGPPGEAGISGLVSASSAASLDIVIDNVTITSSPVVTLSAKNEDGVPVVGLTTSNLRFNIAKLTPGSMGDPSYWQNYINNSNFQGTTERNGILEDLGNGQYTYTFATDITNVTTPLAVSYDPTLTHRVAIQLSGFPATNPVYTFRPSDGATTGLFTRDIVKIENCNSCHNKLAMHGGGRIDTNYCITCHNPGSTDPDTGNTVDFKVMIHKIHRGEDLPSVAFGPDLLEGTLDDGTGKYSIIGYRDREHDYSTVVFPQDIRNCTKCHDGSDPAADNYTPQGDNWKTQLSMEACGSCHDNIDFSKDGSEAGADPLGHPGGIVSDNSECITCHASARIAGSVEERHTNPVKVAVPKFKFNILEICGTAVGSNPICETGSTPIVKFSVTDPTGGTHLYGTNYDVVGDTVGVDKDPEFGTGASLNILTGWDTRDYNNKDGAGSRPARANSLSAITNAVDISSDGTFTITLAAIPGTATGSGVIAIEGHPRSETVVGSGSFNISIPVKGEVAYFGITDSIPVARRITVDVGTKCNECHEQLSFHGNNRADNAQLCVICHNPRNTDVGRRPKTADGFPDVDATADGKREESIDFKRMIHAIHAGQKDDPDTAAVEGHGFREKGINIYGYGESLHDYSQVRFPGILNDCTTCHTDDNYELTGTWESPTQNGILSSTMLAAPYADNEITYTSGLLDQTDDLVISPTAAVCSACHDGVVAQAHMETAGGAQFNVAQSSITGTYETCSVCHGPGNIADVKVVHGIQ